MPSRRAIAFVVGLGALGHTGEVMARGAYTMRGGADIGAPEVLLFDGFDGDVIHLSRGRRLERVKP